MTEIDRLRSIVKTLGDTCVMTMHPGTHKMLVQSINGLEERIAELEAQEFPVDRWTDVKEYIDGVSDSDTVKRYIRHLEAKVAELDHELRCEQIDGGKVRADRKAVTAEQNRQKLAELTTIANAIPPACELARGLVERWIEQVKKELQSNGD